MTPRLLERYRTKIIPELQKNLGFKNKFAVPRLEKIVVNMGVGEAINDIKILDKSVSEMASITGQKPMLRRARKAISNFKLKKGQPVGCKVTLRKSRMYEFLDRLVNVALPRIRDFHGLPPDSFDAAGNYTFGIRDQVIFPEIEYDRITRTQGMDVTIVIKNAKSPGSARELLKQFGFPFSTGE
ncbi:50S ribosomal protein L5 [Candidatus Omnitrophota bacterium]